ncbi:MULTISPECIES: Zn-ribbon domain-containing OB-fold protein [Mycobacteriaceae]|uniref:OB-fold domain-containing protein n=1 Tax=Mycolicibacterium porcinum TaxID=39693 RepID=A0AAW5SXZ8_9MYCO|nr:MULTISPECIES: OB-fold domain-containing protein [Mycobacteriaceae]MCV7388055.1 OB-fold domain-containing protein [Mycolicibacterium porcinum]ORB43416.1 3-ketoacyl-CoA thiolase [Mycolicibacterium porcinum]CDO31260.1 nucleic-acid-binding protein containing a Zn-ribbon [Mycolicibacterium vulneris]
MTTVTTQDWLLDNTLAPTVDGDSLAPLYEAAHRGELVLPFCAGCAQPLELDQEICDRCGDAETNWCAVELRGTVHSATLMHRREPGLVRAQIPYPIVDTELDSGHRLVMTTVQPTDTAPGIGTAVSIGFRRLGDVAIPAIDTLEDQ